MKNKILIVMVSLILLLTTCNVQALEVNNNMKGEVPKFLQGEVKSANLSPDYNIDQALKDVDMLQLNTVNVPVVINVDNIFSSTMTVEKWSKEKAITLIKELKKKNVNIILEAYPWIKSGKELETDWNPIDINTFFRNWKEQVLKPLINDIANPYGVDVVNVGSNFVKMEYAVEDWCNTIDFVRSLYKGLVTYRTNFWWNPEVYEKNLKNKMFSKLDFISVASYFEIAKRDSKWNENTVEKLAKLIECTEAEGRKQNIKKELKALSDKWNKPIFFGELGFPTVKEASYHPWEPCPNKNNYNPINNEEQAKCFEAYKLVFEKEPWLIGFSVFAVGEKSNNKRYYPCEKSVEVIKSWYSKEH